MGVASHPPAGLVGPTGAPGPDDQIHGHLIDSPGPGEDGKVLSWDEGTLTFIWVDQTLPAGPPSFASVERMEAW